MGQVSHYVEAPYQGVSQAPPQVRPDNMAEAIENTLLSLPQGAIKRPPLSWQARMGSHPGMTDGLFEVIDRAGADDAFLTVTKEAGVVVPRVYLTSGLPRGYEPGGYAPETITISTEAQAYLNLNAPTPVSDIVAVTIEDYTFLVNRKAIVAKQSGHAATRPKEAIIWVRQAAYARTFTVTVTPDTGSPVTATLHTPNGKDATDASFVDTEVIAARLCSGGTYSAVNEGSSSGQLDSLTSDSFTVTRVGPVIYIAAPDGVDFTVDVSDGQGGVAMLAHKDKAQRFADLPAKAVAGFTLRITQQSSSPVDDYFVTYQAAAGEGSGVWVETIGPGAELGLDPNTMPVGLTYNGSWHLDVLPWKARAVGDETLAPDPDFVGQTIEDLAFWRGRLSLTSSEAETLSSSDDPFRFYPSTLSTITDADPIALISPLPGKGTFSRAVPFDSRLVVFADKGQAAVQAQGVLTSVNASIDTVGSYEYNGPLRPIEVGERLYFLAPRSTGNSVVYELVGGQDSEGKYRLTGDDMTAAVPSYVPSGIDRSSASGVNYLIVYAKSGTRYLYPHLFRYADHQKVQNAWSRWSLPEGWAVGGVLFRNTQMYVLACKGSETHLVMADIAVGALDPSSSRILTYLDFRLTSAQISVAYASGVSTVSLPYATSSAVQVSIAAPGAVNYPEGLLMGVLSGGTGKAATFVGVNLTGGKPLWVGFQYRMELVLSRFYAVGQDNRPLRSGRLSVRRVVVDLSKTGYLRSEVTIGARAVKTKQFTGNILDDPTTLLDSPPSATTKFSFDVGGENEATVIKLVNDSHLCSIVLGLEWRGELTTKASRI